ncbi:urea ABC transporter substrate-binding protein [Salinarchaeum sp. IM2453]|uniref:urea ABC transporter substrate-binding protein n=1 Tax=Salinarchaeum sp. IM2453 TaxID=2862870 RepID=UPI001C83A7BA|nr:urea ABC transporter substrate-binding protein [Salinarchaeum sp. IM2453]QZA88473.1 urea ABC transporter substrate-binding protein [Salinarchaeum sp. IM2453]
MSDFTRRSFVAGVGGASIAGASGCLGVLGGDDGPTVGVLEDRTGEFQLNGTPKWQATLLAIEEINENGGILGEEINVEDPDPQSDNNRYRDLTERLIYQDEVDALWAGYSSASREAIRDIINDEDQLYFYTTQYEGGVADDTIFPVGATARQQLGAVTPYMADEFGDDIYIIAADYNFGQLSGDWVNVYAKENGYNIVGEEYIPLGETEFSSVINNIQDADPDFIMSMLVGNNHESFYEQRDEAGLDIPIGSSTTLAQGHEHLRYDPTALTDVYVGVNYMEELPSDRNEDFVDRFYDEYPDADYLNQEAQNNYFSVYMWKEAVEEAGTFDQDDVIEVLEDGMEVEAPEGDIELDGATHHMTHRMRVAHCDENHDISFDAEQLIEPTFLREEIGVDLREESLTTQYEPTDVYDIDDV